jgi:hypothetical protein
MTRSRATEPDLARMPLPQTLSLCSEFDSANVTHFRLNLAAIPGRGVWEIFTLRTCPDSCLRCYKGQKVDSRRPKEQYLAVSNWYLAKDLRPSKRTPSTRTTSSSQVSKRSSFRFAGSGFQQEPCPFDPDLCKLDGNKADVCNGECSVYCSPGCSLFAESLEIAAA